NTTGGEESLPLPHRELVGGAEDSAAANIEQASSLARRGIVEVPCRLVYLRAIVKSLAQRVMRQEGKAARKALLQFHICAVVTGGPIPSGRAHGTAPQREWSPIQDRGWIRRIHVQPRLVALAIVHLMDSVRSQVTELDQNIGIHLPLQAEAPLLDGGVAAGGD